ncbi:hypothetical protein BDR05DRAFT_790041 [Suillus weaverae]|nr:hypothetical protein BDR05DRAFT_790041 [Suillus weaverae]
MILNNCLSCLLLAQYCLYIFSSGADQPYQYPISSSPKHCSMLYNCRVILQWRISQARTRSTAGVMLKAIHNRRCSLDLATPPYFPCTSVRLPVCRIQVLLLPRPQSYSESPLPAESRLKCSWMGCQLRTP